MQSETEKKSRTSKSIKNAVIGITGALLSLVISFLSRTVFIRMLGDDYNGVNGLFTNILQTLNMAELGFAAAVAFALYRPLKDGDEEAVSALMNFFARVYRIIAVIVAVAGSACIPALQFLIKEDISSLPFTLNQLRIYFAMFLANTVCSYLLAYKRTLIQADQNAYIISTVDYSCNIALNVLQIALLYITKNYYAFLSIMIAKTIVNNLILHIIAGKRYPYLSKYKRSKITKAEKKNIITNVEALFLHRIGHVLIYSTASIIISSFVGVKEAGFYSNYVLIINNVYVLINIIFESMTASIGNLGVSADVEHQYEVFKRVDYISKFFVVFTSTCYICLFNDFITIWLDSSKTFPLLTVIAISAHPVLSYMRKPVFTFRDAKGLFKKDWFKPLIESSVSIGLAIGLSYVWGVLGILLGYVISSLFIGLPIESYMLYKHGFKRSVLPYFLKVALVIIYAAGVTALTYYICTFIPVEKSLAGFGWFVLEALFCIAFSSGAYILATFKTPEFGYFVQLARKIFGKFSRKKEDADA